MHRRKQSKISSRRNTEKKKIRRRLRSRQLPNLRMAPKLKRKPLRKQRNSPVKSTELPSRS